MTEIRGWYCLNLDVVNRMKKCMTFNRIIAILLMFSAINGVWGCSARNIQQNPDNAESNVLQSQEADITQTVESAQTVQSGEEDI